MNFQTPRHFFVVPALVLALGCATTEKPWVEQKPGRPMAGTNETEMPTAVMPEARILKFKAEGQAELDKALAALRAVVVFFAFDEATLTKDATDKLSTVADILNRHADLDVKIEGNADERGTAQYNLALGQKRADSVKSYLSKLGVKPEQIKAVSFGSEKPADPAHNEDAFAKNRRADVAATVDPKAEPKAEAPKKK
jgi:peptidoglycan-associated lipoprotein